MFEYLSKGEKLYYMSFLLYLANMFVWLMYAGITATSK